MARVAEAFCGLELARQAVAASHHFGRCEWAVAMQRLAMAHGELHGAYRELEAWLRDLPADDSVGGIDG